MSRFVIVFLIAAFSTPTLADEDRPTRASDLLTLVVSWYANSESVDRNNVKISTIDERLSIPDCSAPFEIKYLYASSKRNVVVSCPGTKWKLFLTITSEIEKQAFVYSTQLPAGSLLSADHLSASTTASSDMRILSVRSEFKALNKPILLKDVVQGELVKTSHFDEGVLVFETTKDIQKNTFLTEENVRRGYMGASKAAASQRFLSDPLTGAKARRDLKKGTILANSDIKVRRSAVISSKPIYRGQGLDSDNLTLGFTYEKLSKDSLTSLLDAKDMEITRSVNAGEVIKTSDLRPAKMVLKGESVQLTVSKGALIISSEMIAMEDGKIGDQVSLMNPESKDLVPGIVVGKRKVKGL